MEDFNFSYPQALDDFRRARRKAQMESLMARISGDDINLLSYEDVRKMLQVSGGAERGLQDIPIAGIVGSVGRYADFTRSFLPKQDSTRGRWTRVNMAIASMEGVPPIEVYKIGDVYFVEDGNHRVSVAKQLGAKYIQAYVTEMHTNVPLTSDIKPDELILKAEYSNFLQHTGINRIRPEADLTVTAPGKYRDLEEHIRVHRYYMGIDEKRDISYNEAVAHWYDTVYLPVICTIRTLGLLRDFPDRTEADLYLWIAEHRAELENMLGWEVKPETVAEDLATRFSSKANRVLSRLGDKLLHVITPDELASGPPPGTWREERIAGLRNDRLFSDTLVPINGEESGWRIQEEALKIAKQEEGHLYGLHVVTKAEKRDSQEVQAIKAEFNRRCAKASVPGSLAVEVGNIAHKIIDRARWVDLLVVSLNYPPGIAPLAKLKSGFRTLLQRSPRPLLAVPCRVFPVQRALLAYDGSPKAQEALFLSTYLAARWPDMTLTVLTVGDNDNVSKETLDHAKSYLENHGVTPNCVFMQKGPVSNAILETSEQLNSDLLIMGSYGFGAILELIFGSALDRVLRESHRPILICR